ncbi:MAG: sucrase ferredoxin [Planctomycetes bacterium]|nr:sucrase ferredoxin [Planctomycetota bacterium]
MRPELAGTVKPYGRHLFVCTGRSGWESHIDTAAGLLGQIASSFEYLKEGRESFARKTRVNAVDDPPRGESVDLLVFPDCVRYTGVSEETWPIVRDELLARDRPPGSLGSLAPEPLAGAHVFVCVHRERDPRCGEWGPRVADRFREEIERRALAASVALHRTSHVGGHEFAGNVILFPAGDWYGYVRPDDVPRLLDAALSGVRVEDLWRGGISR